MKPIIACVVVLVLLVGGFIMFEKSRPSEVVSAEKEGVMQESATTQAEELLEQKSGTMHEGVMEASGESAKGDIMTHPGSYEAFAAEKLVKAQSGHVVLFFRASWCPTCKATDADIRSHLGAIPENLTILDVNYDDSAELKKKYGVTYQHTFVQVKADGTMIKKWSGSPTLAALVGEVQ